MRLGKEGPPSQPDGTVAGPPALRIYRTGQREAVDQIVRHFRSGIRSVYLSAPVGSGKSLINLEVAQAIGGAYISTPQVGLVGQYRRDTQFGAKFVGLGTTLVGRANYPCPFLSDHGVGNATADGAPCTYHFNCPVRNDGDCLYYIDRDAAIQGPTAIVTLAYLFTGIRFRLGGLWPNRPLLVLDEAHGLLNGVVEHFAIRIGKETFPGLDFKALSAAPDRLEFLCASLPALATKYEAQLAGAIERLSGEAPTESQAKYLKEIKADHDRALRVIQSLGTAGVTWVYRLDEGRAIHTWRPLRVAPFLATFWSAFPSILLTSGTFVDIARLHSDLGLPTPVKTVQLADTFPAANAPIVLESSVRLSRSTMKAELPEIVREIARIADSHPGQRGVVHCHSYALVTDILDGSPPTMRARLVFHTRENRNEAYDHWLHRGLPDSIFLAVGMYEGLDLNYDLARFQIIVKCPFPDLGDPWVQARMARPGGERWYEDESLVSILQAAGRVMRAADDSGATYVLDRYAVNLIRRRLRDLPDWFVARLVWKP